MKYKQFDDATKVKEQIAFLVGGRHRPKLDLYINMGDYKLLTKYYPEYLQAFSSVHATKYSRVSYVEKAISAAAKPTIFTRIKNWFKGKQKRKRYNPDIFTN